MSDPSPEPIQRLSRDMAKAAASMTIDEARFLVDAYYQLQHNRILADNQTRSKDESREPHEVLKWLASQNDVLEQQVKRSLDKWTDANNVGVWLKEITGIGPVIAAGLLAHIDITKAPTAGHIQRFAGLDPTMLWLGKEKAAAMFKQCFEACDGNLEATVVAIAVKRNMKPAALRSMATVDREGLEVPLTKGTLIAATAKRPFNGKLKTLCWKIGESFVKVSGNPADVYGKLYLERKEYESRKNELGDYADQAREILATKNISRSTDAYKAYVIGKLPPGHIHARAKRWAVKIFISHLHEFWYRDHFGKEPPAPYPIAILGHAHKIEPHRR
jgi:hypothetical protein